MTPTEQAQAILDRHPLPADAEAQLRALEAQARKAGTYDPHEWRWLAEGLTMHQINSKAG